MTYPRWWIEGAEVTIAQASQKKLSPKDKSYAMAKSSESWAYTLAEDCRKLMDWKDGGK